MNLRKTDDLYCKQNSKRKSTVKVLADGVYTAKSQNKITYNGKRESDLR
jgi:hypothetical protein